MGFNSAFKGLKIYKIFLRIIKNQFLIITQTMAHCTYIQTHGFVA